jgi:hypothetical protein
MQVARYVTLLEQSEKLLCESLLLLADRHSQDPEVRDTARLLAGWSAEHADVVAGFVKRYGRRTDPEPDLLRAALFHDPRIGGFGELRDLQDVLLLANHVNDCWAVLGVAMQAVKDEELGSACERSGARTQRQIAWLRTQLRVRAPQALATTPDKVSALKASLPLSPTPVSMPDLLWSPVAAALLVLVVGLLGVAAMHRPWVLPSVGATAYLIAHDTAHPAARPWNVIVGHLVAVLGAFAALALFSAWDEPVVTVAGTLSMTRVLASSLAILLTLLVSIPLRAVHMPAGATALLVTLGAIESPLSAVHLMIGIVLTAAAGYLLRRLRLGRGRGKLERIRSAVRSEWRAATAPPGWAPQAGRARS